MTPKDNNPNAPAPEEDYSLEEILAEYGGSLEHHLLRDAEAPAKPPAPPEEPAPAKEPVSHAGLQSSLSSRTPS